MPVEVLYGSAEEKLTAEEKEAEASLSLSYKNRNQRRHVYLTDPRELKDLLMGIHLYRTTAPNVFDEDQKAHTIKVGAQIERENLTEEEKTKEEDNERSRKEARLRQCGKNSREPQPGENPQPTVLQRLRLIHNTKGKFKSQQSFTQMIHESQTRVIRSRTGVSFSGDVKPRSLDETVDWALAHVKGKNESVLLGKLFSLEDQATRYGLERKLTLERFRALHRRAPLDLDEFASFFVDNVLTTTSLDAEADGGGSGNVIKPSHISSKTRSFNSPGKPLTGASNSHPVGFHDSGNVSLAKRLEQLTVQSPSIAPGSERPAPGGVGSRRRYSLKNCDSGSQLQYFSPSTVISRGLPTTPTFGQQQQGSSSEEAAAEPSSRAASPLPRSSSRERPSSTSRKTIKAAISEKQSEPTPRAPTFRQRRSEAGKNNSDTLSASQPTVYSNAITSNPTSGKEQQNSSVRVAVAAAASQIKAFHAELHDKLEDFRRMDSRILGKCEQVLHGEERFSQNADRLCDSFCRFDEGLDQDVQDLQKKIDDKDYHLPESMALIMSNLKLKDHHFMRDLRLMETRVSGVRSFKALERLHEASWVVDFFPKLREMHRRAPGGHIPPAALLFISAVLNVIMHGWALDQASFYRILEGAVLHADDFSKSAVHRVVSLVREVVGISPEQFLRYLTARDIPPSPELTALIRANRVKRRLAAKRSPTTRSQSSSLRPITEDATLRDERSSPLSALLVNLRGLAVSEIDDDFSDDDPHHTIALY